MYDKGKQNTENNQVNIFGVFQGKKIVWEDKETQTDGQYQEAEAQTDIKVLDGRFDVIFDEMKTMDELVREEKLKRNIISEIPENLEDDLLAELLERNIPIKRTGTMASITLFGGQEGDEEDTPSKNSDDTILQERSSVGSRNRSRRNSHLSSLDNLKTPHSGRISDSGRKFPSVNEFDRKTMILRNILMFI